MSQDETLKYKANSSKLEQLTYTQKRNITINQAVFAQSIFLTKHITTQEEINIIYTNSRIKLISQLTNSAQRESQIESKKFNQTKPKKNKKQQVNKIK